MSQKRKQFYNKKTGKWHILKHEPGKIPAWRLEFVSDEQLEDVPLVRAQDKPKKPEQPDQAAESELSDSSLKPEQSETGQDEPKKSKGFFDFF